MHHTPKKSFGQHFLKSSKVVRAIIEAAELKHGDTVVEVGPGTGVLTRALVGAGARVTAIEADRDLIPALRSEFGDAIELIEGDMLKLDPVALTTPCPFFDAHHPLPLLHEEGCRESRTRKRAIPLLLKEGLGVVSERRYKLVANLPYNVGTEILERFLTSKHPPSRCVVMVQREVGERMLAKPGDMSLLSLAVQLYTDPKRVIRVPPGAFAPPPKVDSLVVRLDWNPKCADPPRLGSGPSAEAVMAIAKAGFRARRKQLHRNLADASVMGSEAAKTWLRSRGLSESARAQELSPKDWIQLCYTVKEYGSSITPHS